MKFYIKTDNVDNILAYRGLIELCDEQEIPLELSGKYCFAKYNYHEDYSDILFIEPPNTADNLKSVHFKGSSVYRKVYRSKDPQYDIVEDRSFDRYGRIESKIKYHAKFGNIDYSKNIELEKYKYLTNNDHIFIFVSIFRNNKNNEEIDFVSFKIIDVNKQDYKLNYSYINFGNNLEKFTAAFELCRKKKKDIDIDTIYKIFLDEGYKLFKDYQYSEDSDYFFDISYGDLLKYKISRYDNKTHIDFAEDKDRKEKTYLHNITINHTKRRKIILSMDINHRLFSKYRTIRIRKLTMDIIKAVSGRKDMVDIVITRISDNFKVTISDISTRFLLLLGIANINKININKIIPNLENFIVPFINTVSEIITEDEFIRRNNVYQLELERKKEEERARREYEKNIARKKNEKDKQRKILEERERRRLLYHERSKRYNTIMSIPINISVDKDVYNEKTFYYNNDIENNDLSLFDDDDISWYKSHYEEENPGGVYISSAEDYINKFKNKFN